MSWNVSTNIVRKVEAAWRIDQLTITPTSDEPSFDQLEAAKRAAKELLKTLPGPFVTVSLAGHANGVGWQKKPSYANDTITVTVTQSTEDDIRFFSDADKERCHLVVESAVVSE